MGKAYTIEKLDKFPKEVYLDKQKDIKVTISVNENNKLIYTITVSNIKSNNLLKNIAKLANGKFDDHKRIVRGLLKKDEFDDSRFILNIERFNSIEIDLDDNTIEIPRIPVALKILMSQKNDLVFDRVKLLKNLEETKTDLHSHYTAMLTPEKLIVLGLKHNINYPISHIYALGLEIPSEQRNQTETQIAELYGNEVLEQIRNNNGNWKEIKDLFVNNEIDVKPIPFKDLIIGEPSEEKSENFNKIMLSCSLPRETQNTFTDMKDTYTNRAQFTNAWGKKFDENLYEEVLSCDNISDDVKEIFEKMCDYRKEGSEFKDNNLQEDMLLWIAKDAREEGIDYIEMSHNALSNEKNQKYLATYDKIMDKIEKETGTRLRMLVGISRTMSYKKFVDNFQNIKESLNSKYVAGIDVLGEETNATQRFEKILGAMTRYALNNDPDMVLRVHAGETEAYDANVTKAIEIVYGEYAKKLKTSEDLSKIKKPNLRIGHGLHGIAEERKQIDKESTMGKIIRQLSKVGILKNKLPEKMSLLDFMAEMGTIIIERCISSNMLLSHENTLGKEPLKTYIDNGVKCVLGTDGYGVYGTSSQEEVLFATTEGINEDYIDMICETEREVIERSKAREEYIENRDINKIQDDIEPISNENTKKQENPEFEDIRVDIFKEFPRDDERKAIVIAGGSFNKYNKEGKYLHSEMNEQDEEILKNIVNTLSPEENIFVIGGMLEAQEQRLVEILEQKNQENESNGKPKFDVFMVTKSYDSLSVENQEKVKKYGIKIVESGQKEELETYKRLEKDIFLNDERKADLIVFDGYQQAQNLLSVANRGKQNRIFYGRENINESLDGRKRILDGIDVISSPRVDVNRFFANSINNSNLIGKNSVDDVDKETSERSQGIDEKQVEGVSLDD